MKTSITAGALALAAACTCSAADSKTPPRVWQHDDGTITVGNLEFESWREYFNSSYFRRFGNKCLYENSGIDPAGALAGGGPSDCSMSFTNPASIYDPSVTKYMIPVVVHVIRNNNGSQGNISEAMVQSNITILNEDFLALSGTPGAPGTDIQIEFFLAQTDPNGNPTNGITYHNNTNWYNDSGSYWNSIAWDPDNYMNIYTNTASGALGYVPFLPQEGSPGSNSDRVVVLWEAFGDNAPIGPPFNGGRTLTHEVGHYLGLHHTFNGGCGGNCSTTGDLVCDTNPQSSPTSGCSGSSCGSSNPIHNYMDYSDDDCMWEFTPDQARRMRCTLEHYRSDLAIIDDGGPTICGAVGAGDCFQEHQGASCDDATCCETVCTVDPTCCENSWDASCVSLAVANCDIPCDNKSECAGDIDLNNVVDGSDLALLLGNWSAGGCSDIDGSGTTDGADLAVMLGNWGECAPPPPTEGCGAPDTGNCNVANGTPYCDDQDCCEAICAADPFCCDTEWDQICADQVGSACD